MRLSLFLTLVFTLSVACSTLAQTTEKCSIVSVAGTAKEVDAGSQIVFIAHLTSNVSIEDKKPEFKWKLSAGTIVSGEGSSSITVGTAGLGGRTITRQLVGGDRPPTLLRRAYSNNGGKD